MVGAALPPTPAPALLDGLVGCVRYQSVVLLVKMVAHALPLTPAAALKGGPEKHVESQVRLNH